MTIVTYKGTNLKFKNYLHQKNNSGTYFSDIHLFPFRNNPVKRSLKKEQHHYQLLALTQSAPTTPTALLKFALIFFNRCLVMPNAL